MLNFKFIFELLHNF